MLVEKDFLLRQVRRFVQAILRSLFGKELKTPEEQRQREREVESLVGTSLDRAEELPVPGILSLLSADGELNAGHALLLGLGLAERAISYRDLGADSVAMMVSHKAAELIRLACEDQPELRSEDLDRILERLDLRE